MQTLRFTFVAATLGLAVGCSSSSEENSPTGGRGGDAGAAGATGAGGTQSAGGTANAGTGTGGNVSSGGSSGLGASGRAGSEALGGGAGSLAGSDTGGAFAGSGMGGAGGGAGSNAGGGAGKSGSGGVGGNGGASGKGGAAGARAGGAGGLAGGAGSSGGNAPCPVPSYIFSETTPVGWASQGGGTTGGGNATPILVTSLSQFTSEVSGSTPKLIYVQGTFSPSKITIGSNKTIIGCSSGAHIQGSLRIGSGTSNVILRNVTISGYAIGNCSLDPDFDSGTGCSSGNDAVGVNGSAHHVWFDHCTVKDGTDGNLDITNDADFVTVSWTKFMYTPRTDSVGSDSTGAAGHRYSNLVGGTDSEPTGWPDTIPLNVTWHHNWWADNVVERQPRIRYGRNHLFNNYYNSSATNYCVRAGIEAKLLLQGNYFDGVDSPQEFNNSSNEQTAYIAVGSGANVNIYQGTSGTQATGGGGTPWTTPPYSFTVDPASNVPSAVMSGAGPH